MSFATVASVATVAAAAASIYAVASAPGAPKYPDSASASREIAEAQAGALPTQRALAAAEQQGGKASVPVAEHKVESKWVRVPRPGDEHRGGKGPTQLVPYVPAEWEAGGKYAALGTPKISSKFTTVPGGTKEVDFAGYGTADIQGQLANKYADLQLELGRKYGTQFAEEAARELELSDPQGTKARQEEYDIIQQMLNDPSPINPLSKTLESQVGSQLKAGSGLDAMSREQLDKAVADANTARGGGLGSNDVERSMSTGYEGQARRDAGIQKAQAFLGSGQTPEDIEYKREQQNLANLSSFVGGRTPQSQFSGLKTAGQGAAPVTGADQAPTMAGGAAQTGGAYSVAAYNAKTNQLANTANPWMSGLSTLLSGLGTVNKAT